DDTHQVRREAREPTVARRAGLASDVRLEAARANLRGSPAVHYVLQDRVHDESYLRAHHLVLLTLRRADGHAAARRHTRDADRRHTRSQLREARVGGRDLQRRRLVRAERVREIVLLRFGKARLRGEAHHATDGHFLRDLDGDDVEAVRERVSDGDGLVRILLAEVAGRVLLIAEGESLRLV